MPGCNRRHRRASGGRAVAGTWSKRSRGGARRAQRERGVVRTTYCECERSVLLGREGRRQHNIALPSLGQLKGELQHACRCHLVVRFRHKLLRRQLRLIRLAWNSVKHTHPNGQHFLAGVLGELDDERGARRWRKDILRILTVSLVLRTAPRKARHPRPPSGLHPRRQLGARSHGTTPQTVTDRHDATLRLVSGAISRARRVHVITVAKKWSRCRIEDGLLREAQRCPRRCGFTQPGSVCNRLGE